VASAENGGFRGAAHQVHVDNSVAIPFLTLMVLSTIKRWLSHPTTRHLDLDDPRTTELRRDVIQSKRFLHDIYSDWYQQIARSVPDGDGEVLEIGSGAGFLAQFIPGLITSELLGCRGVRVILDAEQLPFTGGSLRAVVMTNVLHHVPNPARFLEDAARCVRPGGVVVMVEPWVSTWSRFVYAHLHHEPFDPNAARWELASTGPLSSANGALPWILFARDRERFERQFPEWDIVGVVPCMPFRYLLSGGVSVRSLVPPFTSNFWRAVELKMAPVMNSLAMFAEVTLRRRPS
jgi:SAM-dependent methyltransferase